MVDRLEGPSKAARPPRPDPMAPVAPAAAPAAADLRAAASPVRPLPGGLDGRLVVNSNHPEIVRGPGIALSTLPWSGAAHQDVMLDGPFEVFAHHQNRSQRSLYQAVVLHNPGPEPVRVAIGPSASYVTRDAPYRDTAADIADDPHGRLTSGPGDFVATALLRGERAIAAEAVTLAPGETRLLHTKELFAGNEATSQFTFDASGPVAAAVVIEDAPPTDAAVAARLRAGQRVAPNPGDLAPTPPGAPGGKMYGRVAGVQQGARWVADLGDAGGAIVLPPGDFSRGWVLNAKEKHTVGTDQVQTAPVLTRYPDAAYAAHGNYGLEYDLTIPVRNPTAEPRQVSLAFDTPPTPGAPPPPPPPPFWLGWLASALPFLKLLPGDGQVSRAFRGTVAIETTRGDGRVTTRLVHVSQRLGQKGSRPLHTLTLAPGEAAAMRVRLRYPANATAPHVLRVGSEGPG